MTSASDDGDDTANPVTRLLLNAPGDTDRASRELLPLVYDELRKLASYRMQQERKDHPLQATALAHEAYARLVGKQDLGWSNRLEQQDADAARVVRMRSYCCAGSPNSGRPGFIDDHR